MSKSPLLFLDNLTIQKADAEIPNHNILTSSRPTPQARTKMLQESDPQFQKSNESAYSTDSIVPSRMSISTSQRDSYVSGQNQGTLEYRRLSFEKGLFMSKVYFRSSKNVMIKELSKAKMGFKRKDTATVNDQDITDWEAIRDRRERDSLLATSYEVSINDSPSINPHIYSQQSRPRLSVEDKITSLTGMTLNEELIWACRQGNYLQVKRLADWGVDLHASCKETQHSGLEGIHVAAMYGHIEVVKTLLGYGGMIEKEVTSNRWRPLHVAARSGHAAMVRFLIQQGAQINARACNGIQPIHEASRSGSIEVLDALIEAGAAIDCSNTHGFQPLHYATKVPNRSDVIRYLLEKGANIEAKTSNGSRPLRLACSSDPTNLRTLISLGAEVHYDDGSESVIQAAIRFDSGWAVEILLVHGADPNRQDDKGETVLHQLARIGNKTSTSTAILQVLLDYGADVNIADKAGDQVLHCLAALPPEDRTDTLVIVELATLVLDQGVDIDATNKNGMSPLYLAIQGDNRPLSKLLLRSGARELKRTVALRAEVQVTTLLDSQTPRYTVNIGRGLNGPGGQWPLTTWALSTQSFELSIDDEGYFNMVCEALGDVRAARTREPY